MKYIRTVLLIGVFLIWAMPAVAQSTWRRAFGAFGEDEGQVVGVNGQSELFVCGSTGSFGNGSSDLYMLKIDTTGAVIWSTVIGGDQIDRGEGLALAEDGSLLVAGFSNGGGLGGYDGWVVRTNANGEVIWQHYYGGSGWDMLHSITAMAQGGWLLAGSTYSEGAGGADAWLMHISDEGDLLWSGTFGGTGDDDLQEAIPTEDGGSIAVGSSTDQSGDRNVFVVKLDADWAVEWEQVYGADSVEIGHDIITTVDGGYSVVGSTRAASEWVEHLHLKLNAQGDIEWQRVWGQINDQEPAQLVQLPSGQYATTGYTKTSGGGMKDMFLFISDVDGSFIQQRTYGGSDDDQASSLTLLPGGFALAGWTRSYGAGNQDVFVVRTDTNGSAIETVSTYFDPTDIRVLSRSDGHALHPNPASTTCSISDSERIRHVQLYDPLGRLQRQWSIPIPVSLGLQGLPDGLYTVMIIDDKGARQAAPLMIQSR
jgi:hypothetical protein